MLTVLFGTFLVGELLRPERSEQRTRRPLDPILNVYGKDAAEEYERGGQTSLNNYLDSAQRQSNLRLFIFDNQLRELLGRRIPADAPDVARKVFETQPAGVLEPQWLTAAGATGANGQRHGVCLGGRVAASTPVLDVPPRRSHVSHRSYGRTLLLRPGALFDVAGDKAPCSHACTRSRQFERARSARVGWTAGRVGFISS